MVSIKYFLLLKFKCLLLQLDRETADLWTTLHVSVCGCSNSIRVYAVSVAGIQPLTVLRALKLITDKWSYGFYFLPFQRFSDVIFEV
jgi:hypothetical protein